MNLLQLLQGSSGKCGNRGLLAQTRYERLAKADLGKGKMRQPFERGERLYKGYLLRVQRSHEEPGARDQL